ncbi:MAG: effector binding domain-containing protein [Oscillospiraceae bacterium]|nr:effector binding domain-containing protein [Oscillospiraceae bacterium]
MENLTISQVSKSFGVTPRMLRHYEKMGLITPTHKDDYAYRTYDENAVRRLQQIVILRKLRISLKDISVILDDSKYTVTLEILRRSISELDEEINALDVIRGIIKGFAERLEENRLKADFDLLEDKQLIELSETLSLSKNTLKEERSMSNVNDLNNANGTLNKQQSDIKIVMLPPLTVASHCCVGEEPEDACGKVIEEFVRKSRIYEIKPDTRMFGFNHPNPGVLEGDIHGYEFWVSIPEDMELPEPLVKKHFDGGLYAAMTISFPEFQRWDDLFKWVEGNDKYEVDWRGTEEIMGGGLEEHLNWIYNAHNGWNPETELEVKLDLMLPVKKRGE